MPSTRARTACSAAVVALAVAVAVAPDVHAHGGIPRAIAIHVDPADPDRIVAQSDDWGVFFTDDGGANWKWVCAEAYGDDTLSIRHPPTAVAPGGTLLAAVGADGLTRLEPSGCSSSPHPTLEGQTVVDVERDPGGPDVLVLSSALDGTTASNALHRSIDGGETLETFGPALPDDVLLSSIGMAFETAATPIVVGVSIDGGAPLLLTVDSGAWMTSPLSDLPSDGSLEIWVHPEREELVVLRIDRPPSSQVKDDGKDALYGSTDGGQTFALWIDAAGNLPGLALSPDGMRLATGGPETGLLMADVDSLVADGEAAFAIVFTGPVWGLAWTDAGLVAGLDDFATSLDRSWLGRWDETGETFVPLMTVCDARRPACEDGASTTARCKDVFERLGGFEQSILLGPRCQPAGDGGVDAGTSPNEPDTKDGCGCRTVTRSPQAPWAFVGVALALGLLCRRHGTVQR